MISTHHRYEHGTHHLISSESFSTCSATEYPKYDPAAPNLVKGNRFSKLNALADKAHIPRIVARISRGLVNDLDHILLIVLDGIFDLFDDDDDDDL